MNKNNSKRIKTIIPTNSQVIYSANAQCSYLTNTEVILGMHETQVAQPKKIKTSKILNK